MVKYGLEEDKTDENGCGDVKWTRSGDENRGWDKGEGEE